MWHGKLIIFVKKIGTRYFYSALRKEASELESGSWLALKYNQSSQKCAQIDATSDTKSYDTIEKHKTYFVCHDLLGEA